MQDVARQIRDQDEKLFGSGGAAQPGRIGSILDVDRQNSGTSNPAQRQAVIDEFVCQSAMQTSVVDVTRDKAFQLARDQDSIVVENYTPGQPRNDVNAGTIQVEMDYF